MTDLAHAPVAATPYATGFFQDIRDGSSRSADRVIPEVLRLTAARSVVDVGCGEGAWLSRVAAAGVDDLTGIDGDYVRRDRLMIPVERFIPRDLSQPFRVERRFDLAMSLEVAEHLPASSARGFVESLARLAPVVMFSAAIPFQGGTSHVNEQWPAYWAEHFAAAGFDCFDLLRPRFWNDEAVEWWYRQNLLLFVERGHDLGRGLGAPVVSPQPLVHPRAWTVRNEQLESMQQRRPSIRESAGLLGSALTRRIGLRSR